MKIGLVWLEVCVEFKIKTCFWNIIRQVMLLSLLSQVCYFGLIALMFVQRAMSDSEMPDDSGSESSRGHLSPGESKP